MAKVTKCPKCRLTQMSTTGQCKKCGAPLGGQSTAGPARRAVRPAAPPSPMEHNPYVPPQAAAGGPSYQAADGLWRDGKILVASHDSEFPDRCVKCNQPAEGYRLKRKLAWHPPAWYALILLNILLYAIVATVVQKKSELRVGLCETHRKRRVASIAIGLTLPLLGVAGCSMNMQDPSFIWLGILGLLIGMIVLVAGTSILTAESIDESYARIRGASPAFLAALPPFHR